MLCRNPPTAAADTDSAAHRGHCRPPNSGKSTLFNRLTGLRQKVANFPGVTVEHRMGKVKLEGGREVFVVDLPGVYSLEPRTEDERVTHDVLLGQMKDLPKPDAVLLILDSTNLSSPPGAGRAGAEPGPADAGDSEHGRRSDEPRRRRGRGGTERCSSDRRWRW